MKKRSYTISCSSRFRDEVIQLADKKGVNVGDLARSILLLFDTETLDAYPDPGDPPKDDREVVDVRSGAAAGKTLRRKPRLQVRLPGEFSTVSIRRALALALVLDKGGVALTLEEPGTAQQDTEEVARLRGVIETLAFAPLPGGVQDREEAMYVMGYPANTSPSMTSLRKRFRLLASVYHPDGPDGDHERMAQLNTAMDILKR